MGYGGALRDTGIIDAGNTASGGEPTTTYDYDAAAVRCRQSRTLRGQSLQAREVMDGSQAAPSDVEIRFPGGTTVASKYRIKLTHRKGVALGTAEYYAVIGEPWVTLRHVVCNWRRLIGGSAL